VAYACYPNTQEAEEGGSQVGGNSLAYTVRFYLKKINTLERVGK
jgi:hypothetical protein